MITITEALAFASPRNSLGRRSETYATVSPIYPKCLLHSKKNTVMTVDSEKIHH
jgi:hypothetical protein